MIALDSDLETEQELVVLDRRFLSATDLLVQHRLAVSVVMTGDKSQTAKDARDKPMGRMYPGNRAGIHQDTLAANRFKSGRLRFEHGGAYVLALLKPKSCYPGCLCRLDDSFSGLRRDRDNSRIHLSRQ